jgi:hypothetical protein
MKRDGAQPTDWADQQAQIGNTRFMQCHLPVALYEWLRLSAFVGRTTMNSILLQAITELQTASPDEATPVDLPGTSGASSGVQFNVRLSDAVYEWLRTKAFRSHGSINRLLITALNSHRLRQDGGSALP